MRKLTLNELTELLVKLQMLQWSVFSDRVRLNEEKSKAFDSIRNEILVLQVSLVRDEAERRLKDGEV